MIHLLLGLHLASSRAALAQEPATEAPGVTGEMEAAQDDADSGDTGVTGAVEARPGDGDTGAPAAEPTAEAAFDPALPVVPPQLLEEVLPVYPPDARDRGVEGDVLLLLSVDADGRVVDAVVDVGVDALLDLSALDAARKLRFSPATQAGQPVAVQVRYRFSFDLATAAEQGDPVPGSLLGEVTGPDGHPLPQARLQLLPLDGGAPIDVSLRPDGHYQVPFLDSGEYRLVASAPGNLSMSVDLEIRAGQTLQHSLTLYPEGADEIVVRADVRTWREVERVALEPDEGTVTSSYTLTRRDIEATPGSMEDVARAVHAMPGVVSDGDMLATFNVRGGETGDVVFLLDRVPLTDPFHLAGFNSLFNPDLIDQVQFFAGAPPASVPAGTSAVLDVQTWDGSPAQDGRGIDGALDISASSLRALVMGPIGDTVNVALAARRSYLESYFQVMKWANLIDTAFAAPEFGELSGRVSWRPAADHQLMLTLMRSGDSLALVDSDDDSLIEVDGTLTMSNTLWLLSLDHTWQPDDDHSWRTTVAGTAARSLLDRDLAGTQHQDFRTDRLYARSDGDLKLGPHRLQLGVDAALTRLRAEGDVTDGRSDPTWNLAPIGQYATPQVSLDDALSWPDASAFVDATLDGPVQLRVGGRATWAGSIDELLLSPRAGLSMPLPTGTVPKISGGFYQQAPIDPQVLDPVLGNPDIGAEDATEFVIGVDQGLPLPGPEGGGLLRVELYETQLRHLVVNPDTAAAVDAGGTYENLGTGVNRGIDTMLAGRSGRWRAQATWSLLWARRSNPLNTVYDQEIAPRQDQRHTAALSVEWQATPRWRLTSRYSFHTGRPVSTVAGTGTVDPETGIEDLEITCLNCERMGPFHNLDLRAEYRRIMRNWRLTFYVEVLNATYFTSDYIPIVTIKDGVRSDSMLSHLPTRPFLGVRADF